MGAVVRLPASPTRCSEATGRRPACDPLLTRSGLRFPIREDRDRMVPLVETSASRSSSTLADTWAPSGSWRCWSRSPATPTRPANRRWWGSISAACDGPSALPGSTRPAVPLWAGGSASSTTSDSTSRWTIGPRRRPPGRAAAPGGERPATGEGRGRRVAAAGGQRPEPPPQELLPEGPWRVPGRVATGCLVWVVRPDGLVLCSVPGLTDGALKILSRPGSPRGLIRRPNDAFRFVAGITDASAR
jgi:hypothetical protein